MAAPGELVLHGRVQDQRAARGRGEEAALPRRGRPPRIAALLRRGLGRGRDGRRRTQARGAGERDAGRARRRTTPHARRRGPATTDAPDDHWTEVHRRPCRIEVDRGAAIEARLFAPAVGAAKGAVLIGGAMGVRQAFYAAVRALARRPGLRRRHLRLPRRGRLAPAAEPARLRRRPVRLGARHRRGDRRARATAPATCRSTSSATAWARSCRACCATATASPAWSRSPPAAATGATTRRALKRIGAVLLVRAGAAGDRAVRLLSRARACSKVGDLPRGVVLQWRRWCLNPRYHVGAEGEARARAVRRRALSGRRALDHRRRADDRARHARADRLLRQRAAPSCERIAPADVAARRIGHFGFFRDAVRSPTLWARVTAGWLPEFHSGARRRRHEHQDRHPERRRDDRDRAAREEERDHRRDVPGDGRRARRGAGGQARCARC